MNENVNTNPKTDWLDKPVIKALPLFSREKLILTLIIVLAVLSRFILIGARVMSHDEINHVTPAYSLYQGNGYAHNPVTHGPFQFHMLALSYFLLGDSDFSSRVPAAFFSLCAVIFVLYAFRRYLGRWGTLFGGLLFLVSPYILYYGRYTRNEAFIELFAALTFYAFFRYYEKKDNKALYLLAVTTALQFATKEVAYFYCAQLLLFCGFLFLMDLWKMPWESTKQRADAAVRFLLGVIFILCAFLASMLLKNNSAGISPVILISAGIGVLLILWMIIYTVKALGWKTIRTSTSFNLIVFLGALILPQLTAFPVHLLGWDPLDYSTSGILHTGIVLVILIALSFAIGIWWNRSVFLKSAAAFYLIFIFFYTTVFTNIHGFFTGIIGSLGYWLSQQSVQRGGQPIYYYALIQLPVYEFAAIAGTILALIIAIKKRAFWTRPGDILSDSTEDEVILIPEEPAASDPEELPAALYPEGPEILSDDPVFADKAELSDDPVYADKAELSDDPGFADDAELSDGPDHVEAEEPFEEETADPEAPVEMTGGVSVRSAENQKLPVLLFFLYWSLTSLLAYSIAGEKMPWLTVHIAMPLALSAAWGLGYLTEILPRQKLFSKEGAMGLLGMVIAVFGGCGLAAVFNSVPQPFAGKDLEQLRATFRFVTVLVFFFAGILMVRHYWKKWHFHTVLEVLSLCIMAVLTVLQTRTAYVSSFINYDYANELLVYAHGGPGSKVAYEMIEDLGTRTGVGKNIAVAYDNDTNYPFWWYLRDYTNKKYFGDDNPTRDLRNYDIITANTAKDARLEPIVKDNYYRYEFIRLWWPNQDYFNLTFKGIWKSFTDPQMRSALFRIWLDRDYSAYARVTGKSTLTRETWEPGSRMVMYIRKDLMNRIWTLGSGELISGGTQTAADDEETLFANLSPVLSIGSSGVGDGEFQHPRNLAVSPDGERVYVLDSGNNRVQFFDKTGTYLGQWNSANGIRFSEPWGIAIDSKGNVYIADTWNNRIVKTDAEGSFITEWRANDPSNPGGSFYGPRAIAIRSDNTVYVCDTGYKRIMIYDENGNFINKFGVSGMGMGELDEPVGISLLDDNSLAVADTWNQRVQVFDISGKGFFGGVSLAFDVNAWYTQSLNNKPYITGSSALNAIFLTDPEGSLIHQYDLQGKLVRTWNGAGGDIDRFSMPTGITLGPDNSIWVVDTENNRVNQFVLE
ncbi:MAG: glycosyltransferase family 39 protein [Anaerolineaceae bacterium]|nr:glycosyltransferase family 39 protein [Anaerolineaceae bacterium]